MKNNIKLTASAIFFSATIFISAQEGRVGINTDTPNTTLDVNGKRDGSGNLLTTDMTGLQAPRLTRSELSSKGNSLYGTDQKGALIYITDVSGGDSSGQRINITDTGYYYFDGNLWQTFRSPVADVRRIGTNHISEDAGVGGNGSAMPGNHNIAIGNGAMNNASVGTHPMGLTGNVAIGGGNQLANAASPANVAIGYGSLTNVTEGNGISIGALNLTSLTTGQGNYAIGVNALSSVTTGSQNIGIGANVLQNAVGIKNIALGNDVMTLLTTGQDNAGFGVASGNALTAGSYNTFFGTEAGNRIIGPAADRYTSGDFSLFLGAQTKAQNTVSNQLNIGNWIYGVNGSLSFGNFTGANPLITPTQRIDVTQGNVRVREINSNAGSSGDNVVVADTEGVLKTIAQSALGIEPWQITSTTDKATTNTQNIYQNGNIGVGDFSGTNPIAKLDIRGTVRGGDPHPDEVNGTSPIGYLSSAFGWGNKASGDQATALGYQTQASGNYGSIAAGNKSIASGQSAMALGNNATASFSGSVSMGQVTVSSGVGSVALGQGTVASSIGETSVGIANAITTGDRIFRVATDALFQVGNGTSSGTSIFSRSNALTILKNGNIGTDLAIAPTQRLDIGSGNVRIRDINNVFGATTDKLVTADTDGVLKTISSAGIIKVTTASPVSAGSITQFVGGGSTYYDLLMWELF